MSKTRTSTSNSSNKSKTLSWPTKTISWVDSNIGRFRTHPMFSGIFKLSELSLVYHQFPCSIFPGAPRFSLRILAYSLVFLSKTSGRKAFLPLHFHECKIKKFHNAFPPQKRQHVRQYCVQRCDRKDVPIEAGAPLFGRYPGELYRCMNSCVINLLIATQNY